MGDGKSLKVAAAGPDNDQAMQTVSLLAFTHLLLRGPLMVLLRSNHWTVDVTTIQQAALAISGVTEQALGNDATLAPAPPSRSKQAQLKYEPPLPGQEKQRNTMICETLANMIAKSDSGWVDPSCDMSHLAV